MNELDPKVVSLAKSIRQVESGDNFSAKGASGENGAYQFMPSTWKMWSKEVIGDENAPLTPSNQNAVAYVKIKEWKDSGLNPAQIAAKWNSGSEHGWENKIGTNSYGVKYNVPEYVKKVTDVYQQFKVDTFPQASKDNTADQLSADTYKPLFASSSDDSATEAGLKTLGNIPSSIFNFGKNVVNSLNPIEIARNISEIPGAFREVVDQTGGVGSALGETLKAVPNELYKATVPEAGRAILRGDLQTAQNAIVNDPVGQIAPFLLGAKGVADKGGYGVQFDNAITNTAKAVKPIANVVTAPVRVAGGIVKSASSHIMGLEPGAMKTIIENPEAFSKIQRDQMTRGGLANEFGAAIDDLDGALQEAGTAYNPIRALKSTAVLPENFIEGVFKKFGLKLDNGQVIADTNSITRNPADIRALQNFVDNWGNKTDLTPTEYLNMRKDIGGIARFGQELGKNIDAQIVGTELYAEANRAVRPQIQGLRELDEQYSPIKQQFEQIKRDFLKKDSDGGYSFKDGAINKIANSGGIGKDALIARMEEVMPGIKKKVEILRAVEDIEKAYGNKIGTYTRSIVEGGVILQLTGNVAGVVAAIISNPAIGVPLLRGLGYTVAKVAPIVVALKIVAGDINNMKVLETEQKVKAVSESIENQIPTINAEKRNVPVKSLPSDYEFYQKPKDLPVIDMGKIKKVTSDLPIVR